MHEDLGTPGTALWTYWCSIRQGRLVPNRRDFNPMAIAAQLPIVALLEREAPALWRLRLVGTAIAERYGNVTGRNYLDLLAPEQRATQDRLLSLTLQHPCGSIAMRRARRNDGSYLLARSVGLPLDAPDGERRMYICTNEELDRDYRAPGVDVQDIRIKDRRFLDIGAGVPERVESSPVAAEIASGH